MCRHDDGPPTSIGEEDVADLPSAERIEPAGHLVHAAHGAASREHHAELQLSLLAARERLGVGLGLALQVHRRAQPPRLVARRKRAGGLELVEDPYVLLDVALVPQHVLLGCDTEAARAVD